MKTKLTSFDYPIVLKHVHGNLTISVPDLGISEKIIVDKNFHEAQNLKKNKEVIWHLLESVIAQSVQHIENKKWIPDASQIKTQLKKAEKDYSLPEFQKALSPYLTVSENTLRREIKRGNLICHITAGGHRRIPESELSRYIQDTQTKASVESVGAEIETEI